MLNKKNKKSFTLIELSVVLLVLGFLIAGLLAGRKIIERARMQAVINDVTALKKAYALFVDNYQFIPGDATQTQCENIKELSETCTQDFTLSSGSCMDGTISTSCNTKKLNNQPSGIRGNGVIESSVESVSAILQLIAANLIQDSNEYGKIPSSSENLSLSLANWTATRYGINFFPKTGQSARIYICGITSEYVTIGLSTALSSGCIFPPVGLQEDSSHWVNRNFLEVASNIEADGPAFTIQQAKMIKEKFDSADKPFTGNIMAASSENDAYYQSSGSKATNPDTCTSGANNVSNTWSTSKPEYYSAVPGCRLAFLLDQK